MNYSFTITKWIELVFLIMSLILVDAQEQMPVQLVGHTAVDVQQDLLGVLVAGGDEAMTCDPDLSSSHIPSPHLLSSFEMTVQKSLFRHLLY